MSDEIPNVSGMRIVGGLLVVASIIQIGVAGAAYAMTSWHVGSWWAGVFACITGIFAIISSNKGIVTTGCVFSVISILLCIAGVIFDGIIYGATNALDTCGDRVNGKVYGDSGNGQAILDCFAQNSQDCVCVQNSGDTCYLFNLESADNCGEILTKMPSLLLASLLFVFLLLVLVFTYSVFTCMGVCCVQHPLAAQQNTAATPTATTTNPAQAGTVKATPVTANTV